MSKQDLMAWDDDRKATDQQQTEKPIKKGDFVVYANRSGDRFRALVKTAHRDGGVTVIAFFRIDANNKDLPGYLGYEYSLDAGDFERFEASHV